MAANGPVLAGTRPIRVRTADGVALAGIVVPAPLVERIGCWTSATING